MKNLLLIFCTVVLLAACDTSNEKLKERITGADSVAINYFKGDGSMDTVVAVKIIRDKAIINRLAKGVAETNTDRVFKCGYDGSLHFFKMNRVVQDIDFNTNVADCMHFSFSQEGKVAKTKLSKEAKELLESLKK